MARASQVARVVKNSLAKAEDSSDAGWIPGYGKSPEERMAIHSSILAWEIPWTEGPGGLQSMGSQRVRHNWAIHTHTRGREESCSFPLWFHGHRPAASPSLPSPCPVCCQQQPPPEGPWAGKVRRLGVSVRRCTVQRDGGGHDRDVLPSVAATPGWEIWPCQKVTFFF